MHSPPTDSSGGPNDLVVEIIETLETCGLEDDAYQLHDYVDVDALEQLVSLIRWGHHRPVYRRRNSARGLTGRCRRHRRGRVRVRRRITTFVAETGNVLESPRPLDVPRPRETASRWPSFASLTRTPLRASCLRCLRGRGRPRRPRPFWSPPGLSIPHRATWSAGQVCTYRPAPARRCRPPRRSQLHLFSTWCRKRYLLITMAGQISSFD